MIQQLRIKIVSKSQGRFVKRIKTFLPSFEIQRKNYSKEKENKRGKMDGRDAKGEKRIAQSARGKRCLAGWSRGIVKFVEPCTLAGCLTIADGRRFRATRLRTARSFRLAITMIPGIRRGGERERERERSVLPLTSICKEGEEGRKEGKKMMVENLSNIFCLCLSVIYTLHEA